MQSQARIRSVARDAVARCPRAARTYAKWERAEAKWEPAGGGGILVESRQADLAVVHTHQQQRPCADVHGVL